MDIATLIGFIAAIGVVIVAIVLGGELSSMINIPSLLVVLGGSMGVVLMRFSLGQFLGAVKIALKAFFNKGESLDGLIDQVIELANKSRKEGILALENVEINNKDLKGGIQRLVDGLGADEMEAMMEKEMAMTLTRHALGQQIFRAMGEVAPAMGMIGTLIGLVQMLSNLSDPGALGPAMAVAMLTTLYGAVVANLIALPIAEKLSLRTQEEKIAKSMIIDGVLGIQSGVNPMILSDLLKSYLPSSKRQAAKPDAKEKK
jgi:chemotaxis protein MotA